MTRVRYSGKARDDLLDIAKYIAADNPRRALSFVSELEEAAAALADHPERFSVALRVAGRDVRRRPFGNYAIFYTVEPTEVRIVRVLSSSMDVDEALDD